MIPQLVYCLGKGPLYSSTPPMNARTSLLPLVLALCSAAAQTQLDEPMPERNSARLHRGARPGPWDNDVLVYRVATNRAPEKLCTFERAGVPTLARMKDNRIIAAFQYFPE